MRTTVYKLKSEKISKELKIALVSDLHGETAKGVLEMLRKETPDIIAIPGDITSRLDLLDGEPSHDKMGIISHKNAFELLREASRISKTYYSFGNHELCGHKYRKNSGHRCHAQNLSDIRKSGAVLLDDEYRVDGNIAIGGLTTGHTNADLAPHTGWIEGFSAREEFKILLCHHPEYYERYLKNRDIDLILAGHAHGGQIRLFGRGLFAPGQGVLPKYTSGVHNGRLVISKGLANTAGIIPRVFNPKELVIIKIEPQKGKIY